MGRDKSERELSKTSSIAPAEKKKNKPAATRFSQQQMWACRPILTPGAVILIFLIIGIVFIPIGAACLAASRGVVEVKVRYDDLCMFADGLSADSTKAERDERLLSYDGAGFPCTIDVAIPKKMKAPVFVYYELTNFYQNHRRYVKSRADPELRGDIPSKSALDNCKPQLFTPDSERIVPCGLAAWTYFNDSYSFSTGSSAISVDETGIAWPSDRKRKYAEVEPLNFNTDPALRGGGEIQTEFLSEDEHFMVWMRTATLSNFRKFWGKITTDLKEDTVVSVTVENRYNSYRYEGAKYIVLSTSSWIGGKNDFLGIAFLVVGCTAIGFAVEYFMLDRIFPRKAGDLSYLSWNKAKLAG